MSAEIVVKNTSTAIQSIDFRMAVILVHFLTEHCVSNWISNDRLTTRALDSCLCSRTNNRPDVRTNVPTMLSKWT